MKRADRKEALMIITTGRSPGYVYLHAKAKADGRVHTTLLDWARKDAMGDTPLRSQAQSTLDELCWSPSTAYKVGDVRVVAHELYRMYLNEGGG